MANRLAALARSRTTELEALKRHAERQHWLIKDYQHLTDDILTMLADPRYTKEEMPRHIRNRLNEMRKRFGNKPETPEDSGKPK